MVGSPMVWSMCGRYSFLQLGLQLRQALDAVAAQEPAPVPTAPAPAAAPAEAKDEKKETCLPNVRKIAEILLEEF